MVWISFYAIDRGVEMGDPRLRQKTKGVGENIRNLLNWFRAEQKPSLKWHQVKKCTEIKYATGRIFDPTMNRM